MTSCIPCCMTWVAEMGSSHANRICNKLCDLHITLVHVPGSVVSLIYTACNIADILPVECYKHLTRVFRVPLSCSDINWIIHSKQCSELRSNDVVLRIQAYPKNLESAIIDILLDSSSTSCGIHPTEFTHVFCCVYNISDGIYRFGIVPRDVYFVSRMNSAELWGAVVLQNASNDQQPVCRAYFKMQELFEHYFALWNWNTSHTYGTAVDVGASPGGWTQYLSRISQTVIAIDPGNLHSSVLSLPNVKHVPYLLQHPSAQAELQQATSVDICVCDINVDGVQTSLMLVTQILQPYMLASSTVVNTTPKILILTLKLPKNPSERIIHSVSSQVINILKQQARCEDFRIVHLNANTRNERTLVCKIK